MHTKVASYVYQAQGGRGTIYIKYCTAYHVLIKAITGENSQEEEHLEWQQLQEQQESEQGVSKQVH